MKTDYVKPHKIKWVEYEKIRNKKMRGEQTNTRNPFDYCACCHKRIENCKSWQNEYY